MICPITSELTDLINTIQQHPFLTLEGIFTHLSLQDDAVDLKRIKSFEETVKRWNVPYVSISDSIAYSRFQTTENLYRIGALTYGITSDREIGKIPVQPIATLVSTVTRIIDIDEETDVWYRSRIPAGSRITTIQIG